MSTLPESTAVPTQKPSVGQSEPDTSIQAKNYSKRENTAIVNGLCRAGTEVLFVGLPLLVLYFVIRYKHDGNSLSSSPEWSFASAVLFGLGIVKLVDTVSEVGKAHGARISLLCAIILVLGLVPSLIVLALILLAQTPEPWLIYIQGVLCVAAAIMFFFCSGLAVSIEFHATNPRKASK